MRFAFTLALAVAATGCGVLQRDPGVEPPAAPTQCTPQTCPSGCCLPDAGCLAFYAETDLACGRGGQACQDCTQLPGGACDTSFEHQCFARPWRVPGSGYDCRDAIPIDLVDGGWSARGSIPDGGSLSGLSCAAEGASPALAYELPETAGSETLTVQATALTPGLEPVLAVWGACNASDGFPSASLACAAATDGGSQAALSLDVNATLNANLYVYGAAGTTGDYQLTVSAHAGTCADPIPIDLTNGNATTLANGDAAGNQSMGSCAADGKELVYRIDVPTAGNLFVSVDRGNPALLLRSGCRGTDVVCASSGALEAADLAPGTYYLWLDDLSGGTNYMTVSTRFYPLPPGNSCQNPKPLSFSSGGDGGTAFDSIDLTGSAADSQGSCQSVPFPDVVYSFTTNVPLDLSATTTDKSDILYLQGGGCGGPELACLVEAFSSRPFRAGGLDPGTYWLWVASPSTSDALNATLTPPAPGDNCGAPTPLVFTNGTDGGDVEVTGTTAGLYPDAPSSCGASWDNADEVYSFTTTQVLDLHASSTGSSAQFLYLRSPCRSADLACGQSAVVAGTLLPGTYSLWISDSSPGPYTLTATLTPPVQGDTCVNPAPLSFVASGSDAGVTSGITGGTAGASGDTTRFFNNSEGSCGGAASTDAVYSFSTAAPLQLSASVSANGSGLTPVLYVRSADCDAGTELACGTGTQGGSASISASLPAGSYYLWVDGLGGSSGTYSLSAAVN